MNKLRKLMILFFAIMLLLILIAAVITIIMITKACNLIGLLIFGRESVVLLIQFKSSFMSACLKFSRIVVEGRWQHALWCKMLCRTI